MFADIKQFVHSFGARWFIYMSGAPSVPAAIAAFLVENKTARVCLTITAVVCFVLAALFVWREQYKKVVTLTKLLIPKFAVQYDPHIPMCKSTEIFKDAKTQTEGTAFRIQVSNIGEETIYGCETRLVGVHKVCDQNKISLTTLMWTGYKLSKDIVKGAPDYIGVLEVFANGERNILCEGLGYAREDIIRDPGEYLFKVVVSARNAPVKEFSVIAMLTDDWKAADMRPI
jgi:hypothetical protein